MKIGITGHQRLADPGWVKQELLAILVLQPRPFVGITSLAMGADQLFAEAVLECGGTLHSVIPFAGYEENFDVQALPEYKRLLFLSTQIEVLPEAVSIEMSYLLAGQYVVDLSDLLIAVWNGRPAAGVGGTGDIVAYAQKQGKKLIHINPTLQCPE